jgi:hypothetical protein
MTGARLGAPALGGIAVGRRLERVEAGTSVGSLGRPSIYGYAVPAPPSIRRPLAALDEPALEELVRHGEDLLVERK